MPAGAKLISYLRIKNLKNPTLFLGKYLYMTQIWKYPSTSMQIKTSKNKTWKKPHLAESAFNWPTLQSCIRPLPETHLCTWCTWYIKDILYHTYVSYTYHTSPITYYIILYILSQLSRITLHTSSSRMYSANKHWEFSAGHTGTTGKQLYHSMHFFFLFIGRKPITWPANNSVPTNNSLLMRNTVQMCFAANNILLIHNGNHALV